MKYVLDAHLVKDAIKYAKAAALRHRCIVRASEIDCGRVAPEPGEVGKLVLDAVFAGIECMAWNAADRVRFKPVREE